MKLAHSALAKEIGSDVPLARVLASDSNWKGRAEQISMLKAKLGAALAGDGASASSPVRPPSDPFEERHKAAIRAADSDRRKELFRAVEERDAMVQHCGELKQKCDGLRARNKVLSRDCKSLKERLAEAEKQAAADDTALKNLKAQLIRAAKSQVRQAEKPPQAELSNSIVTPAAAAEVARLTAKCRQQQQHIRKLEAAAAGHDVAVAHAAQAAAAAALSARPDSAASRSRAGSRSGRRSHSSSRRSSRPGSSARPPTLGELTASRASASPEAARLDALCHQQQAQIASLEHRLEQATRETRIDQAAVKAAQAERRPQSGRRSRSAGRTRPPRHDQPAPRPPPSLAAGGDDALMAHEQAVLLRAADAEKLKLTQLVSLLKEQLVEAENRAAPPAAETTGSASGGTAPAGTPSSLEAAVEKLEIQREENRALRTTLKETLQAKESEITLLHSMMKETRRVFSEGLRKYKAAAGLCTGTGTGSAASAASRSRPAHHAGTISRPSSRKSGRTPAGAMLARS